nr:MAG TPA: hypothetical protein [Caudoviricetes sp.]
MEYLNYFNFNYDILPTEVRLIVGSILVLGLPIYFTAILFDVIVGYSRKRKGIDIKEEVERYKVWNFRSNNDGIMMIPNLNMKVRFTNVKRLYFTFRVKHEPAINILEKKYELEYTLCILVVGFKDFIEIVSNYNDHYNRDPLLSYSSWSDTLEIIDRLSMRDIEGINDYIRRHGVNKLFPNILVIPDYRETMILRLLSKVKICLELYTVRDTCLFIRGLRNNDTFCTHLLKMLNVDKLDMISLNGLKDRKS